MYEFLYDWQRATGRPGSLSENVPLKELTSFRIGGPARFAARPRTAAELSSLLRAARQNGLPYAVLGAGSNVLASDAGYPGLLILLSGFDSLKIVGNTLYAGAGLHLSSLSQAALSAGLTGLEFASGIPGSLGGGLFMNAGAYGGEISQVVVRVSVMDEDGAVRVLPASALELGYRSSLLQQRPLIALGAELQLSPEKPEIIRAKMRELSIRRREKQPVEYPSAGSFFKRPEGYFAGALIEGAGLKNTRVGGALVSPKHAGFVINTGKASAEDVRALMAYVRRRVEESSGVRLAAEVRYLSEEGLTELS